MIKALLLIFDPIATWEEIRRARRGTVFVLTGYLLPLLVLVSAVTGYGLVHWGKWQSDVGRLKNFTLGEAVVVEVAQFLASLGVVFIGAKLLKSLGETFHGRHTYQQTISTVAYGLSPLFLVRLLDMFPGVPWWVSWAIGIILSIAVLYHGVPRMMEPDPSHAFGLYLMGMLLLVLVTALARFLMGAYLEGKFPKLQAFISDVAAQLPF